MGIRSVVVSLSRTSLRRSMEGNRGSAISGLRYFSDDRGKILSEEERAAENIYIKKMEKERQEKQKLKAEKEKAEKEKAEKAEKEKSEKKTAGS